MERFPLHSWKTGVYILQRLLILFPPLPLFGFDYLPYSVFLFSKQLSLAASDFEKNESYLCQLVFD